MRLVELFLLLENRIQYVKNAMGPKLQKKIEDDPTVSSETSDEFIDKVAEYDPTKKKLYTQWMVAQYIKGGVKAEDMYKFNDDLTRFEKGKKNLPKKDINQYKSADELFQAVRNIELDDNPEQMSKKQMAKHVKHEGADKLYEDENLVILRLKTEEAACEYGKGTRWCTAATNSNNMFDYYNEEGPIYVIIDKKNNRKWQWHFETEQFMDEQDEDYPPNKLINEYPVIKDVLKEPIAQIKQKRPHDITWMSDEDIAQKLDELVHADNLNFLVHLITTRGETTIDGVKEKWPEQIARIQPQLDARNQDPKHRKNIIFRTEEELGEFIEDAGHVAEIALKEYPKPSAMEVELYNAEDDQRKERNQLVKQLLTWANLPVNKQTIKSLYQHGIYLDDVPDKYLDQSKPTDYRWESTLSVDNIKRFLSRWEQYSTRQLKHIVSLIANKKDITSKDIPKDMLANAPIEVFTPIMGQYETKLPEFLQAMEQAGRQLTPEDALTLKQYMGKKHSSFGSDSMPEVQERLNAILRDTDPDSVITDEFVENHTAQEIHDAVSQFMLAKLDFENMDQEQIMQVAKKTKAIADRYIEKTDDPDYPSPHKKYKDTSTFKDEDDFMHKVMDREMRVDSAPTEYIEAALEQQFEDNTDDTMGIASSYDMGRTTDIMKKINNLEPEQYAAYMDFLADKYYPWMKKDYDKVQSGDFSSAKNPEEAKDHFEQSVYSWGSRFVNSIYPFLGDNLDAALQSEKAKEMHNMAQDIIQQHNIKSYS